MSTRRRSAYRLFVSSVILVVGLTAAAFGQVMAIHYLMYGGLALAVFGSMYFLLLKWRQRLHRSHRR